MKFKYRYKPGIYPVHTHWHAYHPNDSIIKLLSEVNYKLIKILLN